MRQNPSVSARPAKSAAGTTISVNLSAIPPRRPEPKVITEAHRQPAIATARCDAHGPFWPIFEANGAAMCPVEAVQAIKAGSAVLEDPQAAHEAVVTLAENARMLHENTPGVANAPSFQGTEDTVVAYKETGNRLEVEVRARPDHWFTPGVLARTYHDVVTAAGRKLATEAADRAAVAAGVTPDDDVAPGYVPALLTPEQVCEILQVSPRTLDRISGQSIPAPLRIGGQRRWNAVALAQHLTRVAA